MSMHQCGVEGGAPLHLHRQQSVVKVTRPNRLNERGLGAQRFITTIDLASLSGAHPAFSSNVKCSLLYYYE